MSAGRSASGSMPAWLISVTRRGEPEARTSLGRPIMEQLSLGYRGASRGPNPADDYRKAAISTTGSRRPAACGGLEKPRLDARGKLVAHRTIGVEPLLAIALGRGRIGGRPVLHPGGDTVGERQRRVMRLRRQGHDQVEVEAFEVFQLLDGDGLVGGDVDAGFEHCGH